MAKLTTKLRFTNASLITAKDPRKSPIDELNEEILRILPRGTMMVGLTEISSFGLGRMFVVAFDCPFFKKDFEFEVEFTRNILTDGEVLHTYDQATKIINLDEQRERTNG